MNPELRRNLWLELTPHRLVAMPAILGIVVALIAARADDPWATAYVVALAIAVLLAHFWGTRQAAEAVTDEVRDRTWDGQRLSSLTPWRMTWGKLAGAAAFTWYGTAWCLATAAVASVASPREHGWGWVVLFLVASAAMLHGVALASSLQGARKDSRLAARMGIVVLIPALLVVLNFAFRIDSVLRGEVTWYGLAVDKLAFAALSATAFAAWGVLAAHREMSRELRVRTLPWAYPLFTVFLAAYATGFLPPGTPGAAKLFAVLGHLFALGLAYYGFFADVTTSMSLRRLALHLRAGDTRRAFDEMPCWAVALAAAAAFALAAVLLPAVPGREPYLRDLLGLAPIVSLLGGVRDAGLLVFFALAPRARRIETTTLLYLVLLWWVLPGLFDATGLHAVATALRPLRLPGVQGVFVMAVHVALVGAAVAWRWRRMERSFEDRKGARRGV